MVQSWLVFSPSSMVTFFLDAGRNFFQNHSQMHLWVPSYTLETIPWKQGPYLSAPIVRQKGMFSAIIWHFHIVNFYVHYLERNEHAACHYAHTTIPHIQTNLWPKSHPLPNRSSTKSHMLKVNINRQPGVAPDRDLPTLGSTLHRDRPSASPQSQALTCVLPKI